MTLVLSAASLILLDPPDDALRLEPIECRPILMRSPLFLLTWKGSTLRGDLIRIGGWIMATVSAGLFFSPVDFIPEALLGPFGLIDDVVYFCTTGIGTAIGLTAGRKKEK